MEWGQYHGNEAGMGTKIVLVQLSNSNTIPSAHRATQLIERGERFYHNNVM